LVLLMAYRLMGSDGVARLIVLAEESDSQHLQ
jgi:hypothetical protein